MKNVLCLGLYFSTCAIWQISAKPAVNNSFRSPEALLRKAQQDFNMGAYDTSATYYRKYLRKRPADGDAWSQLAVCFYYLGEPEKGLNYLRRWEARSMTKSYNLYHQGLIHLSLNSPDKAIAPLMKASRFADEYSARATFELAVIEYNNKSVPKTTYWINMYKQRYPQGGLIGQIIRMEQSMQTNMWVPDFPGNRRPNQEQALLKYHPYSLTKTPHYWFFQLGYEYRFGDQVQPAPDAPTGTKIEPFSMHDLIVQGGFGIGPLKQNQTTAWVGYNYRQDWFSNDERLLDYIEFEEFTDLIVYFPFRADLMERSHKVYGDVTFNFTENIRIGAFAHQEFSFIGSQFIPSPEGDDIEQYSAQTSESSLLKPYISANILNFWDMTFYLYMYKQLTKDAPETSHKTYNLFDNGDPKMSFGFSNAFHFPEENLNLYFDFLNYTFIYNDPWFDFDRYAAALGIDYTMAPGFIAAAMLGYYDDQYALPMLRQSGCTFRQRSGEREESVAPQECDHKETGMIYQASVAYQWSQFTQLKLSFTMVENQSPNLVVYERNDSTVLFTATMAFPDQKKIARFIESPIRELQTKRTE